MGKCKASKASFPSIFTLIYFNISKRGAQQSERSPPPLYSITAHRSASFFHVWDEKDRWDVGIECIMLNTLPVLYIYIFNI